MKKIGLAIDLGTVQAIMVAAASVVIALTTGLHVYTASGDFALHYDLAQYLATSWAWPKANATRSGMDLYPPLAHYLAAMAGTPVHSTLFGLSLVAALGVFGCYLLLFSAIVDGLLLGSIGAVAVAASVVAYGQSQHAVIGFEVFRNFFYAQLVGQAAFLLFAYWLCRSRLCWGSRLAITAAATFVCGWLYAIAAVELCMAYIWLESLQSFRAALKERRFRLKVVRAPVAGVMVLPPLVLLHPSFKLMVDIANNNGAADFMALNHLIPALAGVLLVSSVALGVVVPADERWRRGTLFLVIAGCSSAAPALLQFVLRILFHLGSEYADKKYGFAVVTVLGFVLGEAVARIIEMKAKHPAPRLLTVALPAVLALAATQLLPPEKGVDVRRLNHFESAVRMMVAEPRIQRTVSGKIMSRDKDYPWYLNYAVTVVDLRMRSDVAFAQATHPDWEFTDRDLAAYAIIEDPNRLAPPRCVLARSIGSELALVSTACYRTSGLDVAQGASFDMAKLNQRPLYFASGWSGKEASGFWNDGTAASLVMHLPSPPPDPVRVSLSVDSFIRRPDHVQHVLASVGGHPLGAWSFDSKHSTGIISLDIPANLISGGRIKIDFQFPDATSPAEQHQSADTRRLAIFVHTLTVGSSRVVGPGFNLQMSRAATKPDFFADGWSGKEATGIWNDGKAATVDMDVGAPPRDLQLSIRGVALIPKSGYVQHVTVSSRGCQLGTWAFDANKPGGQLTFAVPRSLLRQRNLHLDFQFPDSIAPSQLGAGADRRQMAFYVTSVEVAQTAAKPQVCASRVCLCGRRPDAERSRW